MKTILVAVDLSEASTQIIKTAAALAKALEAEMTLLHVVQPVNSSVPLGSAMDVVAVPLPFSTEEIAEIQNNLEKAAEPLKQAGIEVTTIVKEALPVEEINRLATEHHVDFIVVGSHGHGGLYHLFNGSVVTSLLKETTIPVLVVPVRAQGK